MDVFSSLLGPYLGRGALLDHVTCLRLTFWGTARLSSTAATPFRVATGCGRGLSFLSFSPTLVIFRFSPVRVRCHLAVLICVFLMTND